MSCCGVTLTLTPDPPWCVAVATGKLRSGSFATVKRAMCREDGSEWAVKVVDKLAISGHDLQGLLEEVDILESVRTAGTRGWAWEGRGESACEGDLQGHRTQCNPV